MSKSPSLSIEQNNKSSPLPQKIPITYLWFGKDVPEDYLISLAQLNYPVVFLKNPEIKRKFTREILDIQKSDYYRLQHLYEYGGIYSDFDNIIDYPCLMKLLEPYRTQDKLVFMSIGKHTRAKMKQMTNNLIFSPYPKLPILKKMLDSVDEKKGKVWGFAGMKFVATFSEPVEMDMSKCVIHTGDWSWFNASNQVLKKKNPPHSRYAAKLSKKKQIIAKNEKLENQIKQIKSSKDKLSTELKKLKTQNTKLQQQLNTTKTQASKQVIDNLIAQNELKETEDGENVALIEDNLLIQHQVQYLVEKNDTLEGEKDVLMLLTGGSIVLVLLMLAVGWVLFRKSKKGKEFTQMVQTSRSVEEDR